MDTPPSRWLFLCGGLGYSAFLSLFSVGICLLPHRLRCYVFVSLWAAFLLGLTYGVCVLLVLSIWPDDRTLFLGVLTFFGWLLYISIGGACALALYGWYFRFAREAAKRILGQWRH